VINNVSGLGTIFIKMSFASYLAIFLYRFSFSKSIWIFFQNNSDKDYFLKNKIVKAAKVSVIPGSGVDLMKFKFERKNNFGLKFIFVGRLLGDKGIREYLEASKLLFSEFRQLEFLIVGELGYNNPTSISEEEFSDWMKLPFFRYLGKLDDMVEVYGASDIMVLPSYREGLSKSLIEAAAMQLPIITTDVPGCREVVGNSINGFLCEPKSIYSLYFAMKKMILLGEEGRLKMGLESRKIAQSFFDEDIVIDNYISKITSSVRRKSSTCKNGLN
jgi:glycosyltransferase involved in cell wall biosynthesis